MRVFHPHLEAIEPAKWTALRERLEAAEAAGWTFRHGSSDDVYVAERWGAKRFAASLKGLLGYPDVGHERRPTRTGETP